MSRDTHSQVEATTRAGAATPGGRAPAPVREGDDRFVGLAAELGREFASRAAEHDLANTFVTENYARLREAGYLALPVPQALGGAGASLRQVCYAQAELARHCGSTALAVNMHLYLTLVQAFRWRRGDAAAERSLRRIAGEGLVLVTSGGSDWVHPTGQAVRRNGGYRVSGRKTFCSQAPIGGMLVTTAVLDDPTGEPVVLALSIPMSAPGVEIVETWDTLGMRGTASHDVLLTDVAVAEEQVVARRPLGKIDASLFTALLHFAPTASAVYYGIAAGARDIAVEFALASRRGDRPLAEIPCVQRQVGLMDYKLRTAWWALLGALDEVGEDFQPGPSVAVPTALAKRCVTSQAVEVVDLAMEVVGGPSYFRRLPLERIYRDVRAGKYHPFTPEATLFYAGRVALRGAGDEE